MDLERKVEAVRGFAGGEQAEEPRESEWEVPLAHISRTREEEGPLIPADKLLRPEPHGAAFHAESGQEKLQESEEKTVAGDSGLPQFADEDEPRPADRNTVADRPQSTEAESVETLIRLLQAEAHNLQGENLISKNLYDQAIREFSQAIEINHDYVDALLNRGSAYALLGKFNNALMDFNHALKYEKKDGDIYNKRGEIFLQNSMYDQAIKDFTSALILNPTYGYAYLNRGRAYAEKGMPEEAMKDYVQATRTDFEHGSFSLTGQAPLGAIFDEENTDNIEEAATFNQQGLADLKNKKYEAAVESFTQAISLSASDADSYIYRGLAYIKLSHPNKAMADFNQAVLYDPLNPSLYYWRAQVWRAKDDSFNMIEDFKRSCELGYEPACNAYRKHKSPPK
jgi:tetratricopeptide (TPR) repeat protein